MFLKLKDQVVNTKNVVRIDQPKKSAGIEWFITTIMEMGGQESVVNSMYGTEQEAKSDYDRIVAQLCSEK